MNPSVDIVDSNRPNGVQPIRQYKALVWIETGLKLGYILNWISYTFKSKHRSNSPRKLLHHSFKCSLSQNSYIQIPGNLQYFHTSMHRSENHMIFFFQHSFEVKAWFPLRCYSNSNDNWKQNIKFLMNEWNIIDVDENATSSYDPVPVFLKSYIKMRNIH